MQEEFNIEQEIENIKATIMELNGRLKLLMAIRDGGYKIVKAEKPEDKDNESG